MKKKKFRVWLILTIIWMVLIFAHSAMPASVSRQESLGALAILQNLFPGLTHHKLRKIGHFVEFAILGIFLTGTFWHRGKFQLYKPALAALLTALADETLQLFIPGRSGQITDIWLDFCGAATGILIMWLIFCIRKK